jgi:hypothetical protein
MSKIETGGPAFPTNMGGDGMTLRDYIAAEAMAAIIAKLPLKAVHPGGPPDEEYATTITMVVAGAYSYADAMLLMRSWQHQSAPSAPPPPERTA